MAESDFSWLNVIKIGILGAHTMFNKYDKKYQKITDVTEKYFAKKRVPQSLNIEHDEKSNESDDERLVCQMCLSNLRNTVCIPCNHIFTCNSCALKLIETTKLCPYCRAEVIEFTNIRFP
jgi:hypothetical protein